MAVDIHGGESGSIKNSGGKNTAFFNDPKVRSTVIQTILIAILVYGVWSLISNTAANLSVQGKSFGFDFLHNAAGFDVNQALVDYSRASSFWRVYVVGLLNTLLVAITGIFFATLLGFSIGIARLSKNWIVAKAAYCYV